MSIADEIGIALCEYGCAHLEPYIMNEIPRDYSIRDIENAIIKVLGRNEGTKKMFHDVMFSIESCKYKLDRIHVKKEDTVKDVLERIDNAVDLGIVGDRVKLDTKVGNLSPTALEVLLKDGSIKYVYLIL